MLDVALLMANSSQLKTALYVGPRYRFYTPLVALLSVSITLQVIVGLLLIFIGKCPPVVPAVSSRRPALTSVCASSEIRPERREETRQAEQNEQCGHGLRLLHCPHQHLHHGSGPGGTGGQVSSEGRQHVLFFCSAASSVSRSLASPVLSMSEQPSGNTSSGG